VGQQQRLLVEGAPVHLWCRTGSSPRAVVLYAHGYRDTVDSAFVDHHLASQFEAAGLDAFYFAVEAPSGPNEAVVFPSLDELLARLAEAVGGPLPEPTLLIGHSGGVRTLRAWLRSERAEEVVLLDGFYGAPSPWTSWLRERPAAHVRLVGQHTRQRAEAWRRGLALPLRGRVTLEAAGCAHMEVVTARRWLPRVIRESAVSLLASDEV
jgi:hypothetical protein